MAVRGRRGRFSRCALDFSRGGIASHVVLVNCPGHLRWWRKGGHGNALEDAGGRGSGIRNAVSERIERAEVLPFFHHGLGQNNCWGGAEAGETAFEAAAREIREEPGFTDFELGPVVWLREGPLALAGGEMVLFKERYILARCPGGEPSRDGWDDQERALIDDIRWWTLAELRATDDVAHPIGLPDLLVDILDGRLPEPPLAIAWR